MICITILLIKTQNIERMFFAFSFHKDINSKV